MSKADEPAFPMVTPPTCVVYGKGLTKREYFAGLAMGQLISVWPMTDGTLGDRAAVARASISYADALLAALERKPE